MTQLSLSLSRAVARGRTTSSGPPTRAELLRVLLRKRATAYAIGATDLEAMLRAQIQWALPIMRGDEAG